LRDDVNVEFNHLGEGSRLAIADHLWPCSVARCNLRLEPPGLPDKDSPIIDSSLTGAVCAGQSRRTLTRFPRLVARDGHESAQFRMGPAAANGLAIRPAQAM
jgi:hypothetical protein